MNINLLTKRASFVSLLSELGQMDHLTAEQTLNQQIALESLEFLSIFDNAQNDEDYLNLCDQIKTNTVLTKPFKLFLEQKINDARRCLKSMRLFQHNEIQGKRKRTSVLAKTPKKRIKKETWVPMIGDAFTLKDRYLQGPKSEENIANWGGKHRIINIDEACNLMTVKWIKNGVESEYKYDIGYFRAVKSKFTYTAHPLVDVIDEVQTSSQHKHVSVTASTSSLIKETEDSKQSAVSLQSDHECTEATSSVLALEGSAAMSHHQSMPIHLAIANSHLPPKKRKLASMPKVPSNEGVNTTS